MADALLGPDGAPPDAVKDYLGRDAPVALKNPAALPVSGPPAAGVGAGPTNTGGGMASPRQRMRQEFSDPSASIEDLAGLLFPGGGGNNAGASGLGQTGTPNVTGFDPNLASLGLGFLNLAPTAPAGLGLAKGAFSLAQALGALPPANLSFTNPQGQQQPAAGIRAEGLLGKMGVPEGFMAFPDTAFGRSLQAYLNAYPELAHDPMFMAVAEFTGLGKGDRSGETGALGLGPQAAWDAVQAGRSPFDAVPGRAPEDQGTGLGFGAPPGPPGSPPGFPGEGPGAPSGGTPSDSGATGAGGGDL